MELSTAIAIAAFVLSAASMIWVGGFRMSTLIHDVKELKDDMKEVKADIREIKKGFTSVDVRATIPEQQKL